MYAAGSSRFSHLTPQYRKLSCHGLATVVILAAGCASSDPVSMGKDTYMLSNTGAWSWSSGAGLKGELFREADAFCRGQAKQLMPLNTRSNDGSFSQFAHAELQFRCTLEGDVREA